MGLAVHCQIFGVSLILSSTSAVAVDVDILPLQLER